MYMYLEWISYVIAITYCKRISNNFGRRA